MQIICSTTLNIPAHYSKAARATQRDKGQENTPATCPLHQLAGAEVPLQGCEGLKSTRREFSSGYQHALINSSGDLLALPSKVVQGCSPVPSVFSFTRKEVARKRKVTMSARLNSLNSHTLICIIFFNLLSLCYK